MMDTAITFALTAEQRMTIQFALLIRMEHCESMAEATQNDYWRQQYHDAAAARRAIGW